MGLVCALKRFFRKAEPIPEPPLFPPNWPNHQTMLAWMRAWVTFYEAKGFDASYLVNPYTADYLYKRAYAGRIGDTESSLDSAWAALRLERPDLWEQAARDQRQMSMPVVRSRVGPSSDFVVSFDDSGLF
jgi:hypothetical protein